MTTVALTFDDGPDPYSTLALLRALTAGGHRATFFVWGEHAARHPELLREIHAAGMWIGNHSWTHPRLTGRTAAEVAVEIALTQRLVAEVTGSAPTLFRPPYGDTDARVGAVVRAAGLTEVLWSVDTRDWDGASADAIAAAAEAVVPGDVILLHDGGYRTTVEAVPRLLRELTARDLRTGPVPVPGTAVRART